MNPNSQHQLWSRWTTTVVLPHRRSHDVPTFFQDVQREHGHFMRKMFGSTGQARVTRQVGLVDGALTETWLLDARIEGKPVHDPVYRDRMCAAIKGFYERGFGILARVTTTAKLEAGDAQDGKPAAQLLILPSIPLHDDEEILHGIH